MKELEYSELINTNTKIKQPGYHLVNKILEVLTIKKQNYI